MMDTCIFFWQVQAYTNLHILGKLKMKDEVPNSTFREESQQNLETKYDARPES